MLHKYELRRTYRISSVMSSTTKQAGTMMAMIIVLLFGFCVISGVFDILTNV